MGIDIWPYLLLMLSISFSPGYFVSQGGRDEREKDGVPLQSRVTAHSERNGPGKARRDRAVAGGIPFFCCELSAWRLGGNLWLSLRSPTRPIGRVERPCPGRYLLGCIPPRMRLFV